MSKGDENLLEYFRMGFESVLDKLDDEWKYLQPDEQETIFEQAREDAQPVWLKMNPGMTEQEFNRRVDIVIDDLKEEYDNS